MKKATVLAATLKNKHPRICQFDSCQCLFVPVATFAQLSALIYQYLPFLTCNCSILNSIISLEMYSSKIRHLSVHQQLRAKHAVACTCTLSRSTSWLSHYFLPPVSFLTSHQVILDERTYFSLVRSLFLLHGCEMLYFQYKIQTTTQLIYGCTDCHKHVFGSGQHVLQATFQTLVEQQ